MMKTLNAILALSFCLTAMSLNAVTLQPLAPFRVDGLPGGLSGMAWKGGDEWYGVSDKKGMLVLMDIKLDRSTGQVTNAAVLAQVALAGRKDLEAVAWDAENGWVWVADENDNTIRAFLPSTGKEERSVAIPDVYKAFRFNRSFESLSLRSGGREMWTCNEEALSHKNASLKKKAPKVDDGHRATKDHGTIVRLQRFARTDAAAEWRADGQWAYVTDAIGGAQFMGKARCGVAELCCLDNGTLLAMEREMSVKEGGFLPMFRCRIYEVDFRGAADVSKLKSLASSVVTPVTKRLLYDANTGFALYEGMSLGPRLPDGSRVLMLSSDDDGGLPAYLLPLIVRD